MILATAVALMIPSLASNQLVVLAGNVILQPPPMIIAFLAGMLAPRAAWLMGGLLSLLAGIAYAIVVTVNTDVLVTPLGFTYVVTSDQKIAYAMNVLDHRAALRDRGGRLRRLLPAVPQHVHAPAPAGLTPAGGPQALTRTGRSGHPRPRSIQGQSAPRRAPNGRMHGPGEGRGEHPSFAEARAAREAVVILAGVVGCPAAAPRLRGRRLPVAPTRVAPSRGRDPVPPPVGHYPRRRMPA